MSVSGISIAKDAVPIRQNRCGVFFIVLTMKPQSLKPKAQSDWGFCKGVAQCQQIGRLCVYFIQKSAPKPKPRG